MSSGYGPHHRKHNDTKILLLVGMSIDQAIEPKMSSELPLTTGYPFDIFIAM